MTDSKTPGRPLTAAQVLLGPAPPPWWEDSARLLHYVAERAESDKAFAAALVQAIAELHARDKRFRKALGAAITSDRPGARPLTRLDHLQVLTAYDLGMSNGLGHEDRLALIAHLLSITTAAAEKRLAAARKALPDFASTIKPPRRRKNQPNRDG